MRRSIRAAVIVLGAILALVVIGCENAANDRGDVDTYVITGKIDGTSFTYSAGPSDGNSEPLASYNLTQSATEVYGSTAVFPFDPFPPDTPTLILMDIGLTAPGTVSDATIVYYLDGVAHTTDNAATVTITAYGSDGQPVSGTFSGSAGAYTFTEGTFTAWYGGSYTE